MAAVNSATLPSLRNVAFVGQGGVGKTALTDAVLFAAGVVPRRGKVEEGASESDVEPEEVKHKVSIMTSIHSFAWNKHGITLLDTPGYAAFQADARQALRAADGVVFVLPSNGQLKAEGLNAWAWTAEENLPSIGFVSNLDRESWDVDAFLQTASSTLGISVVPLHVPLTDEASGFRGFVDLVGQKAFVFSGEEGAARTEEVPADLADVVAGAREKLVEAVAEASDDLLEKYLEEGELSEEDIRDGLRQGVLERKFLPVLCGSATRVIGAHALLDAVVACLASPVDRAARVGRDPRNDEEVERAPDPSAPFSAFVFKTVVDPFAGRLSIFRIESGTLAHDTTVLNANRGEKEKLHQILRIHGKKQEQVSDAAAGEIVATAKLKLTASGDTLCDEKAAVVFPPLPEFPPAISFAIEPRSRADEEKANQGLQKILEEDLSLRVHRDPQTNEIILSGSGQQHVEVVVERLARKYGVAVDLKAPKVPYREAIRTKASAQGKYKKQTGGRGQFGDAWLEVEPLPRGKGFDFVNKIVGGVIPKQYIPAVEKGVREAMTKGFVAGYPLQDVRVTLYDGSHHSVDSSEMAFKVAGSMAFKAAIEKAKPVLLEPVMRLSVSVPDDVLGDVIGDLNSRRGKVSGVDSRNGMQVIQALVPLSEVLRYASDLNSITSGRGQFSMEFATYEEVPTHLAEKIIEDTRGAHAATASS